MYERAKKEAVRAMKELDCTISNFGTSSESFGRIIDLCRVLRDRARDARGLEEGEKAHALDLLRDAKLLAIAQAGAENYLWRLEALEDDIRRTG